MTSSFLQHCIRPGPASVWRSGLRFGLRSWFRLRASRAPDYVAPNDDELASIERRMEALGMPCADLDLDPVEFGAFAARFRFGPDYHGGTDGGVYQEKLLEHFVAWKILGLDAPGAAPYLDIAACGSPWTRLLREDGIEAYAIDLEVPPQFQALPYYLAGDATRTTFADGSIGSASLQCAFEMFVGDHDQELIAEMARILKPGGRVVVSPLYTHTHACYYQTPEHFGRTPGDPGAKAYVRRDCWGIPASRKYGPESLRARVWEVALRQGLAPRLMALRNKVAFGPGIYLHFVLVLDKPDVATPVPGRNS